MSFTSFTINNKKINIPTPKITPSYFKNEEDILFDGNYKALNGIGQPNTDIYDFSKNNYKQYGLPTKYDLNYLPSNYIKAGWMGTDIEFLNYNPKYILFCEKKQRNSRTSNGVRTGRLEFKKDYVRITHLDGTQPNNRKFGNYGGNKAGNSGDYDLRQAMWDVYIDPTDPLRSADTKVPLNIQPTDYVKEISQGYGKPIFPISYTNWHNDNNTIGYFFGNKGTYKNYFRKSSHKYAMNNKRFVFVIAIEIDNPLAKNKRLIGDYSNEIIFYPQIGKFYDSTNANLVADYFYRWGVEIRQ